MEFKILVLSLLLYLYINILYDLNTWRGFSKGKKQKEVGKCHVFSLTTSGALFIFYKCSTKLGICAMKF